MGLLAALGLMYNESQVLVEHMDNVVSTPSPSPAEGIDKEDIKAAVMPKNSKTIPVDASVRSSIEVAPSDPAQGFSLLHA